MKKQATEAPKCLRNLLAVLEETVDQHMARMLSIGDPISRYYRQYEKEQRMGIRSLLQDTFSQLFTPEQEYAAYLEGLASKSYKWGETWAQVEIPKEVLLEVLYQLRLQVFQVVRETCENSEKKEGVLARVHELAKHYVVEKDVQLFFHYDQEKYPVWAIPSYVEQIGLNLIKNAVDTSGEVHVKLQERQCGTHTVVTVEDNGCGIPEQRIKHLFEPFYTTKEKGTGMGLSVCKQLVEEMGGQIFVQSTVGVGTRIDIHFQKTP